MVYHSISRHIVELLLVAGLLQSPEAYAQDKGDPAPAFSMQSLAGETYTLEQFRGSYVVLEWMNFRCRTVDVLYKNKSLPNMQNLFKEKGVVWLSIVSEALGKQGQVAPGKMLQQLEKRGGNQEAVLLDPSGYVGQMYGAQVSPHLVLINPEGILVYQGALDNQPGGEVSSDEPLRNYVSDALQQAMNGEKVEFARTEAYGCPIRFYR